MKWFDYAAPQSLDQAVALMAAHPGARPLAGGTDLLVQMRSGRKETDYVVDVKRVPELNEIAYDPARGLTLGAAVPCYRIYGSAPVARAYPSLAEVAALIGGTQIQGRASIGGNLCNAAPSADSIPLLIALGARCRIAGPGGHARGCGGRFLHRTRPDRPRTRRVAGVDPSSSARARFRRALPALHPAQRNGYRGGRRRRAGGAGQRQLPLGPHRARRRSLPPRCSSAKPATRWQGKPVNAASLAEAAELARQAARPITDMRGTAEYRRHLCGVLTRRALEAAIERAREAR